MVALFLEALAPIEITEERLYELGCVMTFPYVLVLCTVDIFTKYVLEEEIYFRRTIYISYLLVLPLFSGLFL